MSDLVVLSIEDGAYYFAGQIKKTNGKKRTTTLKEWIRKNGTAGKVYRLAHWETPAMRAQATMTFEEVADKPKAVEKAG